jgi:hypothetical protein
VRDELAAGRFPRKTDRMFYPEGMDFLVLNGANILDAVLSVPLQMLLGGGRGEMWMSVLIAVGNAVSFFPLARSVAPKAPFAAGIATFWFATCPFILGELGGGRPTQAMLWFVPPAVGALMRMQGWRDAVSLGICVGLQGLTYWYLPLFFTMVMAPVAVGRVVREPEVLRYFAVAVGIAVLLVAPLAVPILMAAREGSIPGLDVELAAAGVMLESTERSRRVISTFGLVSTMVPLLAVASRWRTAPGLTIGVALGCLFALGPRVSFAGMQLDNHLYIWLYEHSSLVARLNFPARILSVVYCVAALSLTSVLASSVTRVVPALFAFLMVIEPRANKLAPVRSLALPPLPAAAIVKGRPGLILSVPMGAPEVAMAQQTFHQQPMVSGMADHVSTVRGPGYDTWLENRFFAELVQADDRMRPHTRAEEAEVREAMRWVWFDRAPHGARGPLLRGRLHGALGPLGSGRPGLRGRDGDDRAHGGRGRGGAASCARGPLGRRGVEPRRPGWGHRLGAGAAGRSGRREEDGSRGRPRGQTLGRRREHRAPARRLRRVDGAPAHGASRRRARAGGVTPGGARIGRAVDCQGPIGPPGGGGEGP